MKKIFFSLFFFLIIFNSSLFAFDNSFFSVNDDGWEVRPDSDREFTFKMKDFNSSEDEDDFKMIPSVSVIVSDNDGLVVAKFNQDELNQIKETVENNAISGYINDAKEMAYKALGVNTSKSSYITPFIPREVEKKVEELFEDSGVKSYYYGTIGGNKAYVIDFKVGLIEGRRFALLGLKKSYIIEFRYGENTDIKSLKPYKDFVSSFKMKDSAPTSFNAFIYGSFAKSILKLLIIIAIGGAASFFKKMRQQ